MSGHEHPDTHLAALRAEVDGLREALDDITATAVSYSSEERWGIYPIGLFHAIAKHNALAAALARPSEAPASGDWCAFPVGSGGSDCALPEDHEQHNVKRAGYAGWRYHPFTPPRSPEAPASGERCGWCLMPENVTQHAPGHDDEPETNGRHRFRSVDVPWCEQCQHPGHPGDCGVPFESRFSLGWSPCRCIERAHPEATVDDKHWCRAHDRYEWADRCAPEATPPPAGEPCDLCGSGERYAVTEGPGEPIRIVGCGNPWHYDLPQPGARP